MDALVGVFGFKEEEARLFSSNGLSPEKPSYYLERFEEFKKNPEIRSPIAVIRRWIRQDHSGPVIAQMSTSPKPITETPREDIPEKTIRIDLPSVCPPAIGLHYKRMIDHAILEYRRIHGVV